MPRIRRRRAWRLVLAALVVTLLTACGSDSESNAAGDVPSPEVWDAMERIRSYGEESGAAYYSGLKPSAQSITVYRKPDAGFDGHVRDLAGDVRVDFKKSRYTLRENEELQFAVAATKHPDYQVTSVSAEPDGQTLVVAVAGDTDKARDDLSTRYPGRVEIRSGGQVTERLDIPYPFPT